MEVAGIATTPALTSVLALAATMRAMDCTPGAETLHDLYTHDALVPLYDVSGESSADEAASAVQALEDISDRLRRLHDAYGEWREFDAGAYFDLSHAQTRRLVRVSERVSTVHVTFYRRPAAALLPRRRTPLVLLLLPIVCTFAGRIAIPYRASGRRERFRAAGAAGNDPSVDAPL